MLVFLLNVTLYMHNVCKIAYTTAKGSDFLPRPYYSSLSCLHKPFKPQGFILGFSEQCKTNDDLVHLGYNLSLLVSLVAEKHKSSKELN